MRKLLLIATFTLSLGALAWAQTASFSMDESQGAGNEFNSYDQTVASQANLNSLILAANQASAATESGNWSGTQPGSIASNTEEDFYNQVVATQANLNSLIRSANQASEGTVNRSENWRGPEPGSMAANENADADAGSQSADNDFYNQKVQEQADLDSRFLDAQVLAASTPTEPELNGGEPGSMASDMGAQSGGNDFYGQTVAIQANANRIELGINQ